MRKALLILPLVLVACSASNSTSPVKVASEDVTVTVNQTTLAVNVAITAQYENTDTVASQVNPPTATLVWQDPHGYGTQIQLVSPSGSAANVDLAAGAKITLAWKGSSALSAHKDTLCGTSVQVNLSGDATQRTHDVSVACQ